MVRQILCSTILIFATAVHSQQAFTKEDLLARMSKLQATFDSHKPAQAEEVQALFPEAMGYLSEIQDIKGLKLRERIAAAVNLAISTVPFDEAIPAADVLVLDYSANKAVYESEIARHSNEGSRNQLLTALKGYETTMKEFEREDKKDKAKKAKK